MHLSWGRIAIGGLIAVAAFGGALWASNWLWPGAKDRRPALAEVPPLAPAARNSVIVTPATIALSAIRDAMETAAPRNLAGKRDNVLPQVLSNAQIDWTVARGPLAVAGRPDALAVSTALTGTVRATGQVAGDAGNLVGALGGLLGGRLGEKVQNLQGKSLDQRVDIRGNVMVTSRPALLPTMAGGTQSRLPGRDRGCVAADAGREAQRFKRGQAAARPCRQRADGGVAGAAAQRSRSWSSRRGANGPRCAARSRSAQPAPACRIFGWSCARRAPLRRSRASPKPRSS